MWFVNTRNRSYTPVASNDNAWTHRLMFWPEVDYNVNANLMLGLDETAGLRG